MPHPPAAPLRRAVVVLLCLALVGCGDLAAALPPRPSPFPTLARLPSVTPVTPSPTRPATVTPASIATPTVVPLLASVAVTANVRSGPGVEFGVVGVVEAGTSINLRGRSGEWYQVEQPDGDLGWMSGQVLEVDPTIAASVPAVQP